MAGAAERQQAYAAQRQPPRPAANTTQTAMANPPGRGWAGIGSRVFTNCTEATL
jgi:hypothetical protein